MSSVGPSTWNGSHSTCPVTHLLTFQEKLLFMFEKTSLYLAKVTAGVKCTLDLDKDKENRGCNFQLLEEIRRIPGNILALDIDRTMLHATAVTSELRVGSEVHCLDEDCVVAELHYKLMIEKLRVDGTVVSGTGDLFEIVQICADNAHIPKMNELKWFQVTDAKNATQKVAGRIVCMRLGRLALRRPAAGHRPADATFFLDVNRETIRGLKLLHSAVDLSFEGLCVRLRPGLREFLKWAQPRFEVVLFTAAQRKVYEPMLEEIHQLIGGYSENRYWNRKVLFREDCSELRFSNGNVRYMKDIFAKGFPPSRSLLVDDTRSVFAGIEPNGVVIAAFKGAADDCELMNTLKPILERVVAAESADIRYALNGVRPLSPSQRKDAAATVCQKLEELALTRDFIHAWLL